MPALRTRAGDRRLTLPPGTATFYSSELIFYLIGGLLENNFSRSLICPDEVKSADSKLELGIRLPWYRALPLSVVEVDEILIDGNVVKHQNVYFEINGKEHPVDRLGDLTGEFWYVLDSARLRIPLALDPEQSHTIALTVNLYPPYIPGLTWVTRGSLVLEAKR